MRVLLFYPSISSYGAANRTVHSAVCAMPPIGLATIASALRNDGHEVRLIDASLDCRIDNGRWAIEIVKWQPDLVGFSAITVNFLSAYEVCTKVKRLNDSIRTVFGGAHVSWGRERILKQFEAIDLAATGEGEYSLCKIAGGEPPSSVAGVFYRNGPIIEQGPDQIKLCDMDSLPFPAYDLLRGFPRAYALPLFSYPVHPGAGVISSRGCVHRCSYCDRSVFGKTYRWNSPEYTLEHILRLRRDFGVRHINFYDDQFVENRNRTARLCELLVKNKRPVTFNCIAHLGSIDETLCSLLKSAGCWMVSVGIESGEQRLLDMHKSGLTIETIRRAVRMLSNNGLYVKGLFMMGMPGETEESIQKTRELALSLPLKDANITAFTPFPGAPITPEISNHGTFENDWSKMDCEHFVFMPNTLPSKGILEQQRAKFITSFYQRRAMRRIYLKMLYQSPHSYWRLLKNVRTFSGYLFDVNKTSNATGA